MVGTLVLEDVLVTDGETSDREGLPVSDSVPVTERDWEPVTEADAQGDKVGEAEAHRVAFEVMLCVRVLGKEVDAVKLGLSEGVRLAKADAESDAKDRDAVLLEVGEPEARAEGGRDTVSEREGLVVRVVEAVEDAVLEAVAVEEGYSRIVSVGTTPVGSAVPGM